MMNSTIFKIGVKEEHSEYLNEKIQATNFLCVFFGILSLTFSGITYSLIPGLAYLPALLFLTAGCGILLNYLDLVGSARFLMCIGSLLFCVVYSSFITPDGEPLIAGFLALQVLFLLPPWILFDLEEKTALIWYSSIALIITLMLPYFNNLFSYNVTLEVVNLFKAGWPFYVCLATAVLGIFGVLLFLEVLTFQTGRNNMKLIGEMSQKAVLIAANEKKLSDYIAEIEAGKKEGEKRQWAANGIAKFADLLRVNHNDSQKMYDSIVSNLVKYIDANQAGLFLIDGENDDRVLKLVAMYAYDRKKYLAKTVSIGEGILGQVVLEKAPVYLSVVPDEFLMISSGLGESPPRSLLISPLIVNEEVYGVIELASFKAFDPHVREFVARVGESIASTISSVRVNEKTKVLLEELQQQTEEMKSQEEEMRQNMEELVATQEEMQRKEQEYLQRIEDLEMNVVTQLNN